MSRFDQEDEELKFPVNPMARLKKLWQKVVFQYGSSEGKRWTRELWLSGLNERELTELETLVGHLLDQSKKPDVLEFRKAVLDWLAEPDTLKICFFPGAYLSKLEALIEQARLDRMAAGRRADEEVRRTDEETRRADEERAGREAAEARIKALEERLAATGLEEEETAVPSKRPRG